MSKAEFQEYGRISLFFHQLPAIEANQDFQLWVIEEGQPPHPSATFVGTGPVTEVEVDLPIAADHPFKKTIHPTPPVRIPQR